jgi:hypothetical protein
MFLLISLVQFSQCGTGDLGSKCLLTTDCKNEYTCDIRVVPITQTCLGGLGTKCTKDLDCANGLFCLSGQCGCKANITYYNSDVKDCLNREAFGGKCESDQQCLDDLVCSQVGSLKGTCKVTLGELCSNSRDCANEQSCIDGKCGCIVRKTEAIFKE